MERKRILGYYDYTVILTYLGMIISFAGIINALNRQFTACIICLMFAGICDMFDGAVASTKIRDHYEKHFGIQIDSLCDLISFGILPAIFFYMHSDCSVISGIISCVYLLAALIRLAYFNVQEYERQSVSIGRREAYLGLPVTTVALFLPLSYLICDGRGSGKSDFYGILLSIMAVCFISGFEIKKPKMIGKIVMIVIGILEVLGVFVFSGADLL